MATGTEPGGDVEVPIPEDEAGAEPQLAASIMINAPITGRLQRLIGLPLQETFQHPRMFPSLRLARVIKSTSRGGPHPTLCGVKYVGM